jgi:dipeptidyl aminopeptidase/acylaminoacyl peptidase
VFGQSRYAFAAGDRVVFAYQRDGLDHLAVLGPGGVADDLDLPYTAISSVEAAGDRVVFVGASATAEPAVVAIRLAPGPGAALAGEPEIVRAPRDLGVDPGWFSVPEPVDFPTSGGRTAHALYYPPTNPEAVPPAGEAPPLLVLIHGGPTAAARPMLQLGTQYWTSRGFGGVDVNYVGSTGYGRAYREALATETHKFESRYLDGLIGPYPDRRDLYVERSPVHHLDGFDRPLIVLQGLEDEVVPPNQAEMIVDALRSRKVPVAYVTFPGEQHGFRQAANIRRALDAELSFYAQVFGFATPEAEGIEPVTVENL